MNGPLVDSDERKARSSEKFNHLQELFDKSFKAARVGIWECSLRDQSLTWTDTVYEIFDLEPQSQLNRDEIVALYSAESRVRLAEVRTAAIREGSGFSLDAEIITAKGNNRWIRITAIVERDPNGEPLRVFGMKQDITAEKIMFDQIRRISEIDCLTGLASRSKFEANLECACSGQIAVAHALVLIDLDGFKSVNDTLGHQAGDKCLQDAANRLILAAPGFSTVARLGGDEFAIILPYKSEFDLQTIGQNIVDQMRMRIRSPGIFIEVGASAGGTPIFAGKAPKDIFALADSALYAAKREGKGRFRLVGEAVGNEELDKLPNSVRRRRFAKHPA
ncbi:diguanylate cyclase [Agrobacterium tumefaciens]|nr:diguanylate cyclase [Agrobacterium tumefaciens]